MVIKLLEKAYKIVTSIHGSELHQFAYKLLKGHHIIK